MRKYAARPNLARVLCDYIMYVVSFVFCVLGVGGGGEARTLPSGCGNTATASGRFSLLGRQRRMATTTGPAEGARGGNACSHSYGWQQHV